MIYSSKIDFKPFARIWRRYQENLDVLDCSVCFEYHPIEEAAFDSDGEKFLRLQMRFGHSGQTEEEKLVQQNASRAVTAAADEWADMLSPLQKLQSEALPRSYYGSGLMEIRSAVYCYHGHSDVDGAVFDIAWTNECAAPLELLRLASRRWNILDDADKSLVVSALAGWLSTQVKHRQDNARITDADFVTNVCLAIANSSLFPPSILEEFQLSGEQFFTPDLVDLVSGAHACIFQAWCEEFFEKGVRDPENELRRTLHQQQKEISYGNFYDIEQLGDNDLLNAFVSPIDPLQIFETNEEIKRLMLGLSLEEQALLNLVAQGYSLAEIAQKMKVHKSTIHSRLFKIRKKASR